MDDIACLIERARAYSKTTGLAPSTVSRKILGNGKRLDELASGQSLRVDTLAKAHSLLDELEAQRAA